MSKVITVDELTSYMSGTTLTPVVAQQVVDGVNAWIERVTHRCWGETKTATERHDYGRAIYLRHQDVVSVQAVKLGYPSDTPVVLTSSDYTVNSIGRLTPVRNNWLGPWFGRGYSSRTYWADDYVEVQYTYGVEEVPEDLKLAALGIAASTYNWAQNDNSDVTEASVGSYSVKFGSGQDAKGGGVSSHNLSVIKSYATKRML